MTISSTEPFFDWYQTTLFADTVHIDPEPQISVLAQELGSVVRDDARGMHGFSTTTILRGVEGEVLARIFHGGQAWASVQGSGAVSGRVAEVTRQHWPRQRVSRVDSAMDWAGEDAWETLKGCALALADQKNLKVSYEGDWHRGEEGRTFYVGSRKSSVFMRCYEKGIKEGSEYDQTWVRTELVVRPKKDAARKAVFMEPGEFWGMSVWGREMFQRLMSTDVDRVVMRPAMAGDDSRALDVLCAQYGNVLTRKRNQLGSDKKLGRYLMAKIAEGRRLDSLKKAV